MVCEMIFCFVMFSFVLFFYIKCKSVVISSSSLSFFLMLQSGTVESSRGSLY